MFILHFQPIEHYPPVLNLLGCVEDQAYCCTTKSTKYVVYQDKKHSIYRFSKTSPRKLNRLWQYFWFNLASTLLLFWKRPASVLYYETISAFPALLYKKIRGKKVKVAVHYHEYVSPEEHRKGMFINKKLHAFEQKMYAQLDWISQTNTIRKQLFCDDENIPLDNVQTVANYPTRYWAKKNNVWNKEETLKLIFVGYSVDPKGSYIKEVIDWLSLQAIKTQLDIYCLQQDSLPKSLKGSKGSVSVQLHPPVNYENLPETLKRYHIGLILYKGLTPNYVHNAPNKLFEYLSCGLDVWYPTEMDGIKPYQNNTSPKVIEFDFKNLTNNYLEEKMVTQSHSKCNLKTYIAEEEYKSLIKKLIV